MQARIMTIFYVNYNKEHIMEKTEAIVGTKFVLVEKLGQGSFGQVYRGYNKETKEQVAVKLVNIKR